MTQPDREPALFFSLATGRAAAWFAAVQQAREAGIEVAPDYAGPCASALARPGDGYLLTPDWTVMASPGAATPSDIVCAAQENGILSAPRDVHLDCRQGEPGTCSWTVALDWAPGVTLTSEVRALTSIGAPHASGLDAFLGVLKDAVDEGNGLLDRLYECAPLIMARTSRDPVLLTRLADHPDASVRAYAKQNAACPEEGRVLAVLRDRANQL